MKFTKIWLKHNRISSMWFWNWHFWDWVAGRITKNQVSDLESGPYFNYPCLKLGDTIEKCSEIYCRWKTMYELSFDFKQLAKKQSLKRNCSRTSMPLIRDGLTGFSSKEEPIAYPWFNVKKQQKPGRFMESLPGQCIGKFTDKKKFNEQTEMWFIYLYIDSIFYLKKLV